MKTLIVHPSPILKGTIQVPGDKSISHRAVMFSCLSQGRSVLRGLLLGEDVRSTIACFQAMGVRVQVDDSEVTIDGVGLHGLKAPEAVLDCGNSGTTMRLMMGILAGQPFVSRLTGDASLNRRPVERVAAPLRQMGAHIEELRASPTERVVKITGRPLNAIRYALPMASAQVKSAVLLAALYARGTTEIVEPISSRDHTEIMLRAKGVKLEKHGEVWRLESGQEMRVQDIEIPGDISSAAFWLVGGALGSESEIALRNVGVNPTRTGILEVLQSMGAKLEVTPRPSAGGEAVADLKISSSALQATRIGGSLIPRLIDEIPILSIAMGAAHGLSQVSDASELRVKESDRIAAIEREFSLVGLKIETRPDGFSVQGPTAFRAFQGQSGGDHRIAMSLTIAATQAKEDCNIDDIDCIATSYPEFFDQFGFLGGHFRITP